MPAFVIKGIQGLDALPNLSVAASFSSRQDAEAVLHFLHQNGLTEGEVKEISDSPEIKDEAEADSQIAAALEEINAALNNINTTAEGVAYTYAILLRASLRLGSPWYWIWPANKEFRQFNRLAGGRVLEQLKDKGWEEEIESTIMVPPLFEEIVYLRRKVNP